MDLLYEYLRTGRPILAVTHNGDTVELIQGGGTGRPVAPDDVQGIKQALRATICGNLRTGLPSDARREFVERCRYDRLAEKVVRVMDSIMSYAT